MRPRRSMLALLVGMAVALMTALILPGLGGREQVRSERPQVEFVADEYSITPSNLSVRPGRIKLVMRNQGRLTHNVRVQRIPDDEERGKVLGGTPTAQPGQRVERKLRLERGVYRLTCTIGNHDDLGSHGTLVVEGEPLQ